MKTKRHVLILLVVALAMLSIVPALTVTAQDSLIESLCLVTDVGSITDGTFNQFAYEGSKKAADEFGLDFKYIETQPPANSETYRANIQTCLNDKYDAIVTIGFLMAEETTKAAQQNPDTYFIGVDQGSTGEKNYAGLLFREDQAGFLAGALAAQVSKSGTVAGVYGIDIPPVIKYRNGYEQGAKYINPDIKTLGVYIPSFTDPAAGGAAANSAIGEGADVVFGAGGPTGTGGIKEAAQKGVLVIGVDQDEYATSFGGGKAPGADNLISSAMKRVDQAVYLGVKALVDGGADFPAGGNLILSAANDGVGFAPPHDAADKISADVTAKMNEILAGLKDGSIVTGVDPVSGQMLPDLLTAAQTAGNLTTLLKALDAAGFKDLMAAIPAGAGITVFAPTDDAFAALPAGDLDKILADPTQLQTLLSYHVVTGAHLASDLAGMESIDTITGGTITVTAGDDGSVTLNDSAKVVQADILFDHGVIHLIDSVLTPPAAS